MYINYKKFYQLRKLFLILWDIGHAESKSVYRISKNLKSRLLMNESSLLYFAIYCQLLFIIRTLWFCLKNSI